MLLISPNFAVKSIIFSQFWPGAFSKNCWKSPVCRGSFIFYQHQESRTLGRIAAIMPEVLRWSKIALKEDHEQMINVTFGILSWVGIAAPVEFKDSLAEFVDIMLVSEKCQDLYCKFSETCLKRPVKKWTKQT